MSQVVEIVKNFQSKGGK